MKSAAFIKKTIIILLSIGILSILSIYVCNNIVEKSTERFRYLDVNKIPKQRVGLLLGTAKFLKNGNINPYYLYRINAAVALYKAGKVEYILVSGDNGSVNYDEPTAFKEDLMKAGIPENKIVLDYAGFRTLDSVVRAKEVFGQESITVISQGFHNARAIYLAQHFEINAVGFDAKDIAGEKGMKVQIREKLARVKMMLDLMFNKQPKFLGDKVNIGA